MSVSCHVVKESSRLHANSQHHATRAEGDGITTTTIFSTKGLHGYSRSHRRHSQRRGICDNRIVARRELLHTKNTYSVHDFAAAVGGAKKILKARCPPKQIVEAPLHPRYK